MEVVLAGASGLLGRHCASRCARTGTGSRRWSGANRSGPDEDSWDPAAGLWSTPNFLAGADAVVCLSGAGVGDTAGPTRTSSTIVPSRVDSVGTLARIAGRVRRRRGSSSWPRRSATTATPATPTVDEDAPPGDSFLPRSACSGRPPPTRPREAGVRVTHLRTGLVLAKDGGLLKRLVPIVKAGVGGKLGDGRQFMPWISLTDEIAAIRFLLEHDVAGPVNLTAPTPVRNAEFTQTLGQVLHRPTVLPVPGFAARIALGEFAERRADRPARGAGPAAGRRLRVHAHRPGSRAARGAPLISAGRGYCRAARSAVTDPGTGSPAPPMLRCHRRRRSAPASRSP